MVHDNGVFVGDSDRKVTSQGQANMNCGLGRPAKYRLHRSLPRSLFGGGGKKTTVRCQMRQCGEDQALWGENSILTKKSGGR